MGTAYVAPDAGWPAARGFVIRAGVHSGARSTNTCAVELRALAVGLDRLDQR